MSTRRERLEKARDRLASAIDQCQSSRDLPSLVREYRATLADLAALPETREVSAADEIAERRNLRRKTNSNRSARTANKG